MQVVDLLLVTTSLNARLSLSFDDFIFAAEDPRPQRNKTHKYNVEMQ
jgi:hypothetical protein